MQYVTQRCRMHGAQVESSLLSAGTQSLYPRVLLKLDVLYRFTDVQLQSSNAFILKSL